MESAARAHQMPASWLGRLAHAVSVLLGAVLALFTAHRLSIAALDAGFQRQGCFRQATGAAHPREPTSLASTTKPARLRPVREVIHGVRIGNNCQHSMHAREHHHNACITTTPAPGEEENWYFECGQAPDQSLCCDCAKPRLAQNTTHILHVYKTNNNGHRPSVLIIRLSYLLMVQVGTKLLLTREWKGHVGGRIGRQRVRMLEASTWSRSGGR